MAWRKKFGRGQEAGDKRHIVHIWADQTVEEGVWSNPGQFYHLLVKNHWREGNNEPEVSATQKGFNAKKGTGV
jgi:hypothetical protein